MMFKLIIMTNIWCRIHRIESKANINSSSTPVYISIHVRRTDYGKYLNDWFKKEYVEDNYFIRAIQHYRELYNVSTVFLTHIQST